MSIVDAIYNNIKKNNQRNKIECEHGEGRIGIARYWIDSIN